MIKKGIGVSDGLGLAKAYKYLSHQLTFDASLGNDPCVELECLEDAINKTKEEIKELQKNAHDLLTEDDKHIFDAHLLMLEDEYFLKEVVELINRGHVASYSFKTVMDRYLFSFKEMEDEYLKERSVDLSDVYKKVIAHLKGITQRLPDFKEEVVLVVDDLTPSDTIGLDFKMVKAIVSERGGKTSHSSIIARTLGIPAVVGVNISNIETGDDILVDGRYGYVRINPSEEELKDYQSSIQKIEAKQKRLEAFKNKKTRTKDGYNVKLGLNISNHEEIMQAQISEGIGLYRTEFLFMAAEDLPDLETQVKVYEETLKSKITEINVIRTLDIGGDKGLTYFPMEQEDNPFLGKRAIRLSLSHKNIFKTQLKAMLIANKWGNLAILLPMISTIDELNEAKEILKEVEDELVSEGYKLKPYQLGIMIEVPIAALSIDDLITEVDFVSVGSNDLIQYLFAADRMNEEVSYLYQPFHPRLLELIEKVIKSGKKHEKWVGICGEMAGVKESAVLLLALGAMELSMNYKSILEIRELFSKLTINEAINLKNEALKLKTNKEVYKLAHEFVKKIEKRK